MAHHCIKYRLNSDGTVPDLLCLHPDGVGGVYGAATPGGTTRHDDAELDPNDPNSTIPFNPAAAATWVWGRLDALNAAE